MSTLLDPLSATFEIVVAALYNPLMRYIIYVKIVGRTQNGETGQCYIDVGL